MSNFSDVDMATAAAQGFRDGVASVEKSEIPNNQGASAAQAVRVPEARVTGAWESARIGDFNAGWNAFRDSIITLLKASAYMELDTTKRSIAIQDELRAMLSAAPAQQVEAVDVVAYLDAHDCLWNETTHPDRMIPLMTVGQHRRIMAAFVPAGCKVVPVEATEDMEEAGCQAYMNADAAAWIMHRSSMGASYKAMVAAANGGKLIPLELLMRLCARPFDIEECMTIDRASALEELRALLASAEGVRP